MNKHINIYKHFTFLVCCLLLPLVALQAQQVTIKFFKGTWEQALAKAKEEGKLVFLDAYADYCIPCKQMEEEIFSNKDVAIYYNKHFVGYKLDMEKDESDDFAMQYEVFSIPTFLFFDADGNFIKKEVGKFAPSVFIKRAKAVVDQVMNPTPAIVYTRPSTNKPTNLTPRPNKSITKAKPKPQKPDNWGYASKPKVAPQKKVVAKPRVIPKPTHKPSTVNTIAKTVPQPKKQPTVQPKPQQKPKPQVTQPVSKTITKKQPKKTTKPVNNSIAKETILNEKHQILPGFNPNHVPTSPIPLSDRDKEKEIDIKEMVRRLVENEPKTVTFSYSPTEKPTKANSAEKMAMKEKDYQRLAVLEQEIRDIDLVDSEVLAEYAYLAKASHRPYNVIVNKYIELEQDKMKLPINRDFVFDFSTNLENSAIDFFVEDIAYFKEIYSGDRINEKIKEAIYQSVLTAIEERDNKLFEKSLAVIKEASLPDQDFFTFEMKSWFYQGVEDWDKYAKTAYNFITTRRIDEPVLLNEIAWTFHQYVTNKKMLKYALVWSKKSVKIENEYYNNYTHAALLYKLGDQVQAMITIQNAIQIAKVRGILYERALRLRDKISSRQ